ncbi:MAG: T9SS type A sorting domain-containing protein [Crocinitomix sp.]|nr:T9SS type A sorting domain-containing protein [Crocinitomix sp.]
MQHNNYKKLKGLAGYINQLIKSGEWRVLSKVQKDSLKSALKRLVNSVRQFIGKQRLVTTLGAAIMLISVNANAQSFADPVMNPFSMGTEGYYYTKHQLVDLDGDGDLDLFYSNPDDEVFYYQENTGTATAPAFADAISNPFGLAPTYPLYTPILADLDNDGDLDFIRTENYGFSVYFHENTGDSESPVFSGGDGVVSPFGIDPLGAEEYFVAPTLADIDGDGDYDLFISEPYGNTYFYENRAIVASIPDAAEWTDEIILFPNPAVDNITIQTALTNEAIQSIRITTVDGRQVYQTSQLVNTINVSDFETGIYLLEVTNNDGQQLLLKFVKE